jgi:hypothetical protein
MGLAVVVVTAGGGREAIDDGENEFRMIDSEHHKLPQVSLAKPVAHATAVNWPHIDVTDADGKHLQTVFDVGMGSWRLCPGS